jgi:hypothetical protein
MQIHIAFYFWIMSPILLFLVSAWSACVSASRFKLPSSVRVISGAGLTRNCLWQDCRAF